MKKDVLVNVKGVQGHIEDSEAIEMFTEGEFFEKNGSYYVKYIDHMLDEEKETNTTIKISPDKVSIIRFGSANTHMLFEQGKTHYSPYETPFGIFDMMLKTEAIELKLEEDFLHVFVKYHLELNKTAYQASTFELEVRSNH